MTPHFYLMGEGYGRRPHPDGIAARDTLFAGRLPMASNGTADVDVDLRVQGRYFCLRSTPSPLRIGLFGELVCALDWCRLLHYPPPVPRGLCHPLGRCNPPTVVTSFFMSICNRPRMCHPSLFWSTCYVLYWAGIYIPRNHWLMRGEGA